MNLVHVKYFDFWEFLASFLEWGGGGGLFVGWVDIVMEMQAWLCIRDTIHGLPQNNEYFLQTYKTGSFASSWWVIYCDKTAIVGSDFIDFET